MKVLPIIDQRIDFLFSQNKILVSKIVLTKCVIITDLSFFCLSDMAREKHHYKL